MTPAVTTLLQRLDALPAKHGNAAMVLHVCDDPNATSATLGAAVLSDAFLTAKLLKLANSAYFGLAREVSDPATAVSVLGFDTVRALALAQLGGALGESSEVPPVFWTWAARIGAATSMFARRFDVPAGEAFAAGLLHDLGRAVLLDLGADVGFDDPRCADDVVHERDDIGIDHCEIGLRLCTAMELPQSFAEAIGHHHEPAAPGDPALRRALWVGITTARWDGEAPLPADLGVADEEVARVHAAIDSEAAHLAAVLV